jgi:hypothetical protein
VSLFLLNEVAEHTQSIQAQNIPYAKSWSHAVFIKDEPNADLVLVKEQKAKKCLYIDNGPARGRIHDGLV